MKTLKLSSILKVEVAGEVDMKQLQEIENSKQLISEPSRQPSEHSALVDNSSLELLKENLAVLSSLTARLQFLKKEISYLIR